MLQYASLAKYPAAKEQIALFAKMILVAILKVVVFAFYLQNATVLPNTLAWKCCTCFLAFCKGPLICDWHYRIPNWV